MSAKITLNRFTISCSFDSVRFLNLAAGSCVLMHFNFPQWIIEEKNSTKLNFKYVIAERGGMQCNLQFFHSEYYFVTCFNNCCKKRAPFPPKQRCAKQIAIVCIKWFSCFSWTAFHYLLLFSTVWMKKEFVCGAECDWMFIKKFLFFSLIFLWILSSRFVGRPQQNLCNSTLALGI